ncbi:MAG TPA: LysR family transcriptional regulator [Gammaproteobacteria bacterium]|nr:LysR family transcriptional regulator [Gammaproteobacteria bacterium]
MPRSALALQPLLAFAETAKRGNFATAARELGCTPSTLAKAVARLEKQLGVRLFYRTTRQVTLTDDGERLFGRSQRVLAELEELRLEASGATAEPTGTLRIDMPVSFGRAVMLPLLAELARRHPRLHLDVRLSDVYVDIVKEGIDVAIRTGALRDSTLVARPFGSQTLLLCAAPSYLAAAGTPKSLEELRRHTAVLFRVPSTGRDRPWQLRSGTRNVELLPGSRMRIDEGDGLVAAAALGLGISQQPHYMVTERLARGELVEVMPELRPPPMPISAVMTGARLMPARVRALLDFLDQSRDRLPPAPSIPARRRRSRMRVREAR